MIISQYNLPCCTEVCYTVIKKLVYLITYLLDNQITAIIVQFKIQSQFAKEYKNSVVNDTNIVRGLPKGRFGFNHTALLYHIILYYKYYIFTASK